MFAKYHTIEAVNQCQYKCTEKFPEVPLNTNLFKENYSYGFGG